MQAGVSIAAERKARFRQDALAEASSQEEAVRAQGVNLATACEPDLATRRRIADILVDAHEGMR